MTPTYREHDTLARIMRETLVEHNPSLTCPCGVECSTADDFLSHLDVCRQLRLHLRDQITLSNAKRYAEAQQKESERQEAHKKWSWLRRLLDWIGYQP